MQAETGLLRVNEQEKKFVEELARKHEVSASKIASIIVDFGKSHETNLEKYITLRLGRIY